MLVLLGILAVGRSRIGFAAIGANQPVDHQLHRARRMIPVDRRDQHDAVRPNPEWVDVVHHVLRLAERVVGVAGAGPRSEEHTSELQSLMRISYAVFCLKKKKNNYI